MGFRSKALCDVFCNPHGTRYWSHQNRTSSKQPRARLPATRNLPSPVYVCVPVSRPASVQPRSTSNCGTIANGSSTSENIRRKTTIVKGSPNQQTSCSNRGGSRGRSTRVACRHRSVSQDVIGARPGARGGLTRTRDVFDCYHGAEQPTRQQ